MNPAVRLCHMEVLRFACPPMAELSGQTVTHWLQRWRGGDAAALDEITALLYSDLRKLASGYLRGERSDHTLQATALVHEAYLQVHGLQHIDWKSRAHFIGLMAQVMRHVLVDHARARAADKRGGGLAKVPLDGSELAPASDIDLLALNDALDRLASDSPRKAKSIELFYFGGLRAKEISEVLSVGDTSVSLRTVESDLQIGRAKLHRWLRGGEAEHA